MQATDSLTEEKTHDFVENSTGVQHNAIDFK